MTDKAKNKLDETIDYIKKLDSNIALCWDQWKADLHNKLQNICKSQKELDLVVDLLKKQNIGGITHEVIDKVAEYLVDENFNNPKWDEDILED